MLVAEYDYETDIEVQREEAYEEGERAGRRAGRLEGEKTGRSEGEFLKLVKMTVKKLQKGHTVEETAKMLEEPLETIQKIYNTAGEEVQKYDVEDIYRKCRI